MTAVAAFLGLLAFDKETLMIAAFGALIGAGVIVSLGAWILFARERRPTRRVRGT